MTLDTTGFDVDALRLVFYSPIYQNHFEPFLKRLEGRWTEELLNPTEERRARNPDDYLRGGIAVVRALVAFPQALIAEDDRERAGQAATKAEDEHYSRIAREGRPAPLDTPAPTDPI